jgi:hypothetical protein
MHGRESANGIPLGAMHGFSRHVKLGGLKTPRLQLKISTDAWKPVSQFDVQLLPEDITSPSKQAGEAA